LTELEESKPLSVSDVSKMAEGVANFFDVLRAEQIATRGRDALLTVRVNHPRPRLVPAAEMRSADGAEFISSAVDPLEALDQICEQMMYRSMVSSIIRADLQVLSLPAVEQFLEILMDAGAPITPARELVSFCVAIGLHKSSPCGRIIFFGDRARNEGVSGRVASHEIAAACGTMKEVVEELYYKASDPLALEQYRRSSTSKVA